MDRYKSQSSAKSLADDVTLSDKSFMWQRILIGPKTVPYGTPESTVVSQRISHSTFMNMMRIDLAVEKFDSHLCMFPFIPY